MPKAKTKIRLKDESVLPAWAKYYAACRHDCGDGHVWFTWTWYFSKPRWSNIKTWEEKLHCKGGWSRSGHIPEKYAPKVPDDFDVKGSVVMVGK